MTKYAAFLRGIGPTNPNMKGEKLQWAFEEMGFKHVRPFLASGNLIFEASSINTDGLEQMIEAALPELLGFSRDAFVRSQADIQKLVDANPFGSRKHENAGKTYLTVTFFKTPPIDLPKLPFQPEGKSFELLTEANGALCSVVDLRTGKTPDLMAYLERQFGKRLTTRTWATITRLLDKLN